MMGITRFLVTLASFSWPSINADIEGEIIANLGSLGNTELHFISDFSSARQEQVLMDLNLMSVPYFAYDLQELRDHQLSLPVEKCPIFGLGHGAGDHGDDHGDGHDDGHGEGHDDGHDDDGHDDGHDDEHGDEHDDGHGDGHGNGHDNGHDEGHDEEKWGDEGKPEKTSGWNGDDDRVGTELYLRDMAHYKRPQFLQMDRFHKSVVVWAESENWIPEILRIFDDTIMSCEQKIEVGIYHHKTRFFFLVKGMNETVTLFEHDKLQTHARVAAISRVEEGKEDTYRFVNYNFFHDDDTVENTLNTSFIWRPDKLVEDEKEVFTNQKDFMGHHFKIATNPWSHHVLGDTIPEDEGGNATMKYRNYWGYEIALLEETAKILNFTYTIGNPADGKWGHIEADGTWSGLVAEAASGAVDFVICDIFIVYSRIQVRYFP